MTASNFNIIQQAKVLNLAGAIRFFKELLGIQTPRATVERSLMAQHGISLRDARQIVRTTRNRTGGHRRRHTGKKES